MSSMKKNTAIGRSQAIKHRKSRVSGGVKSSATPPTRAKRKPTSAPLVETAKVQPAPLQAQVSEPSTRRPVRSSQPIAVAEGRDAAKKRRKQTMRGQTSSAKPQSQVRTRTKKQPEAIIEPREKNESKASRIETPTARRAPVKSLNIDDNSGRKMSKARRKAITKGKMGETSYKSKTGQAGSLAKLNNPEASTRDIARSVRADRCSKGKTICNNSEASSKRQNRKNRAKNALEKVGVSETLSGQEVSGTIVGQGQMTGAETGACKLVSGTEYLGVEEFTNNCSEVPDSSPAKVTMTQTTRGQTISGNRMGQDKSVTGNRQGQCSGVTGTEYLASDQSVAFCGTDVVNKATSASAFSISPGPSASNTANNATNVSGGNDFPAMSGRVLPSSGEVPKKVVMSNTFAGNTTSGTQVGSLKAVTGVESGYCKSVTGTGYQGKEEVETVCQTSAPAVQPTKVNVSGTMSGQTVTGDRSGGNDHITGGEAGRCKAVSGTPYMGKESFTNNCSTEEQAFAQKKTVHSERQFGHALTGVQPGPQGITGAQKGACELVSGTHYQGADQMSTMCQTANAATPGESDFPMMMGQALMPTVDMTQPLPTAVEPASNITGDGWDRGSKVTGTDGPFATQRNPSIRGGAMQTPMGAANFRPVAMEEVPQSPITGSAGNTGLGAKVTLSGGARA